MATVRGGLQGIGAGARRTLCASLVGLLAGCTPFVFHAPDPEAALQRAIESARQARIDGPAEVRLAGRTVLLLQAGLTYIPPAEVARILRTIGAPARERLLGVVVAGNANASGIAAIYARNGGYDGIPEIEVTGWDPAPALHLSILTEPRQ